VFEPDGDWTDVLQNSVTVNDADGQINFAGGRGTGGTNATEDFVLATVKFKAKVESESANVTFNTDGIRHTKVMSGFNDVTGNLDGLTLSIDESVIVPVDIVTFTFTLQGVGEELPEEWTMPFAVEFYESGTSNVAIPLNVVTTATSTSGASSFEVEGIMPGTYSIWVKGENTLAKLLDEVEISATSNTVPLGVHVSGDATQSNVIDIDDYQLFIDLAIDENFPVAADDGGLSEDQQRMDFNRDVVIDTVDYGFVLNNFGTAGLPQPGAE
jgi:hypothetical protein